jgi:hypothetical protein
MRVTTAEEYKARYAKRGEKQRQKRDRSFVQRAGQLNTNMNSVQIGFAMPANHQERTVSIETCFPLFEHHGKRKLARFYK